MVYYVFKMHFGFEKVTNIRDFIDLYNFHKIKKFKLPEEMRFSNNKSSFA